MKKFITILFSSYIMAFSLLVFAVSIAVATFLENSYGNVAAREMVYNAWWFEILLFIGIVNLTGTIIIKRLYRIEKLTIFVFHLSFLFILIGAAITRYIGYEGSMHIREGETSNVMICDNSSTIAVKKSIDKYGQSVVYLPFSLQLNEFIIEHYPGSNSPSWFESKVTVVDSLEKRKTEERIYMNHILSYKGYRFYQSSYDSDGKGTILSVNHDFWGTATTYFGYFMLFAGIILSLFNRNSRFLLLSRELTRIKGLSKTTPVATLVLLSTLWFSTNSTANSVIPDNYKIDQQHAAKFGMLLIQDPGGRIKPINTLSSELVRKVSRENTILDQNADQVVLGMLVFPDLWQNVPMIQVSNPDIRAILHTKQSKVSFNSFIDTSSQKSDYILRNYVETAYQKKPSDRSKFDTDIIRIDERVNVCYLVYSGQFLRIFPNPTDSNKRWFTPMASGFAGADSIFVHHAINLYFEEITKSIKTKQWQNSDQILTAISNFQKQKGAAIVPSSFRTKLEVIYNKSDIFYRLGSLYGVLGFMLLILQFIAIFSSKWNFKYSISTLNILIIVAFLLHFIGLAARWYVSEHAPWSNAYESMIYIAFATVLAGIIFARKQVIALSATALLAWLILFVAHLNWLDPQITNLAPVLQSYWLVIHVAIITASYGFLILGALLAFINLCVMMFRNEKNNFHITKIINELTCIIEMTLIIGLYMLTIGTFLGGIWANESWGRYWGWDPKETWALVSILIYAFVVHVRLIPSLNSTYLFNVLSLLSFSSIIMTYFGVNYYLSGMHSYAKGDSIPIPTFVYYTLGVIVIVSAMAWRKRKSDNI